jgi:hypothetical protein
MERRVIRLLLTDGGAIKDDAECIQKIFFGDFVRMCDAVEISHGKQMRPFVILVPGIHLLNIIQMR